MSPRKTSRRKVRRKRYAHAGRRAQERYNLELTKEELDVVARRIRKQKGTVFLRRISNTRTEWLLSWHEGVIRVGYCNTTHQVTTFLPLPDVEQARLKQMFDTLQAKKKEKRNVRTDGSAD